LVPSDKIRAVSDQIVGLVPVVQAIFREVPVSPVTSAELVSALAAAKVSAEAETVHALVRVAVTVRVPVVVAAETSAPTIAIPTASNAGNNFFLSKSGMDFTCVCLFIFLLLIGDIIWVYAVCSPVFSRLD
jgi:hypothetical protein